MSCRCVLCLLEEVVRDQLDIPAPVVRTGQGSFIRDYPLQSQVSTQKDTQFTITCTLQGDGKRVLKINGLPIITSRDPAEMSQFKTLVEVSLTLYKKHLQKHNLLVTTPTPIPEKSDSPNCTLRYKMSKAIIGKFNRFNTHSLSEVNTGDDSIPIKELDITVNGHWKDLKKAFHDKDVIPDNQNLSFNPPMNEKCKERGYNP